MAKKLAFSGLLSNGLKFNPDYYNCNRVEVWYCDGSSFTGDVEAVDHATNLQFRGTRLFRAVMDDILAKGKKNAENVVLSGCSAGGLTAILHCDNFKALVPSTTKVKCFPDTGYFMNVNDVSGAPYTESFYNDVVITHGSAKNLATACVTECKVGATQCYVALNPKVEGVNGE